MWGANFFQVFFVSLLWSRRAVAENAFTLGPFDKVIPMVAYGSAFSEDVKSCPDFQNNHFDATGLKLQSDDGLGLAGPIDLKSAIVEGNEMCAEAWKITEVGNELVFNACGDICDNLDDQNSPWYPLFYSLNATMCPIEAKLYEVDDMIIDLSFANGVMCHEFCAEYLVTLQVMDGRDVLACYEFTICIFEYET